VEDKVLQSETIKHEILHNPYSLEYDNVQH
jgi:hypothetical protein